MSNSKRNGKGQWTGPDGQHRLSNTPEYRVWVVMIQRCFDPKNKDYARYGGRGILVCNGWKNSFATFIADMGRRPSKLHTLDRKDNDKGYWPDNCRWATRAEQSRNLSSNHWIEWDGAKFILADLARSFGLRPQDLSYRLRHGWELRKALETPVKRRAA